jgi:hypothetical protein
MDLKAQWFSPKYKVAYIDWQNVYLLPEIKLNLEIYKGGFYYRVPKTTKRINKEKLTESLIKKEVTIKQYIPF